MYTHTGAQALSALTQRRSGFTLIEVLVVIGIIAILAAVVIIAINPARQFAEARNSQRVANVNAILNAIGQDLADNKGVFTCNGSAYALSSVTPGALIKSGASGADLAACLVPTYLPAALPFDPSAGGAHWSSASDYDTEYTLTASSTGRVTICAPGADEASLGHPGAYCLTR